MTPNIRDLRWQAEDPLAGLTMMVSASYDQRSWRFRYDDNGEANATWIAAQNTAVTEPPSTNFRLRFEVQETAGGSQNNRTIVLQYNVNGTGWNDINGTTPVVRLFESPHVANGTTTTNQLTAGTGDFIPGIVATTTSGTDISFSGNDHTEVEWCCQIMAGDVSNDDTIEFRVTINGAIADTSSAGNASLTVTVPSQGTFTIADDATVEWSGSKPIAATFAVTDDVMATWEGSGPSVWGEPQTFTNIFDTLYDDTTVVPGEWYRYRVAGALNEEPQSDWSDWVQALAEIDTDVDVGTVFGSGVGAGVVSADQIPVFIASLSSSGVGSGNASGVESITPTGTFAVDDTTTVEWSAYRTSTAVFAVSDSVTAEWMGYEPPNPTPTNLTVTPIGATQLKVDWDSPLSRFTLRREEWVGAGDPILLLAADGTGGTLVADQNHSLVLKADQ